MYRISSPPRDHKPPDKRLRVRSLHLPDRAPRHNLSDMRLAINPYVKPHYPLRARNYYYHRGEVRRDDSETITARRAARDHHQRVGSTVEERRGIRQSQAAETAGMAGLSLHRATTRAHHRGRAATMTA